VGPSRPADQSPAERKRSAALADLREIEDTINNQRHRYTLYGEIAGYMQKIRDRLRQAIADLEEAELEDSPEGRVNRAFQEQLHGEA
jgi:hypothetical protein